MLPRTGAGACCKPSASEICAARTSDHRRGVEQTRGYMDRCGAEVGHLIVFDRAPDRPWEEKIFRRPPSGAGVPVTVWGM